MRKKNGKRMKQLMAWFLIAAMMLTSQNVIVSAMEINGEKVQDDEQLVSENVSNFNSLVSIGNGTSSVITANGDLYCWGNNSHGQVGNGTKENQQTPIKVLTDVVSIFMDSQTSSAITANGDLYCWGDNWIGQVGNGTKEDQLTPTKILSGVVSVLIADGHSSAITVDGDLYCWGDNRCGQVGNGTTKDQLTPIKVLSNVESIFIGNDNYGAITINGDLYCWGSNAFGVVGNGIREYQLTPTIVLSNVVSAFMGFNHAGAITTNGDLYCWGDNTCGQIGNGTTECQLTPTRVLSDVVFASEEFYRSSAITKNGDLYCWGDNIYGQVGNGTTECQLTPTKVLSDVVFASEEDFYHSSAITANGDLYCWGARSKLGSEVGSGTKEDQLTPIKVLSDVVFASGGLYHSSAITANGELYCWGDNRWGEVGNGTMEYQLAPTKVLSDVVSVFMGSYNIGAVTTNGDLYCWGNNEYGQVGNGTTKDQLTPQKIMNLGKIGADEDVISPVFAFAMEETKIGVEGTTIALSGTITLDDSVEAIEKNLSKAAEAIIFESSDESKAKVLTYEIIQNDDLKSAKLKVWVTLYNEGTATITAKSAHSPAVNCKISISSDTSGTNNTYDEDYASELQDFFIDRGMTNTIKYFCQDGNFPASVFVSENDTTFGSMLSMYVTDTIYRGWDGWRDLIDGSTSVEDAEKILASLLTDYQEKIKGLSEVKTAQKYGKMINNAFLEYTKSTNLLQTQDSIIIETAKEYFSEDNIAKLLYEGKYDELLIMEPVNQILPPGTASAKAWNDLMGGFTQSAELSKTLKKGWQKKIGNFEIGGGLDDLGKTLNMISFAQNTVNYLYRLESLLTVDEMYCEMLKYVENHCVYSVVQQAAANLYSVINDGVEGIIADIALKAANRVGKKTIDFALKTACDSCLPFAIIKAGFDWGVTLSNVLFKTGETQELKDSLRSQAYFANCLALWTLDNGVEYLRSIDTDKETENGRKFYYSLYMVWKARINAEETLQNLLKTEKVKWCKNYSISVNVKNLLKSYQDQLFSEERMQKMLGVTISCPVNVEIYDASGTKILTLMDGKECQGYENGIYYYCSYNLLSEDYEKYIYYNAKDNYHINLVGTDLGLVDGSVSSIDDNGNIVEYYFYNKEIDSDTVIMLDNISKDGIDYHIKKNDGEKIDLSMERKSPNVILATSLSLNKTSFEMKKNDKCLLTVSFVPINATNQNVTWSSSDETVALVNSDGVITAVASGTATISVSLGDLKQNCEITVKESNSENLHCKHQYIWVTDKFPTRAEEGSKHLECLLCNNKIVFVKIPKIAVSNNDDKNVSDLGTIYLDAASGAIYKITKDDANARTASYLKTKVSSGTLAVPDTIQFKGKTFNVTEISNGAGSNNAKITKVIIGKNVTSVGQGAFSRCSKLKTVTIGKSVTSIGKNAFFGCSQLKTVVIGKNVTSIKSKAFSQCVSLKQVVIPSKVKNIGSKAFYGCSGLKKLTIKTTKLTGKSIGSKAFSGVSKKVTAKVPKGKLKSYKKMLKKKGIGKKAKVK